MAKFELAHKIVMQHEGGYANNPKDRGGETYKGVSRKNFPLWAGWSIVDRVKMMNPKPGSIDNLLQSQTDLQNMVLSFYKTNFWDALNLDAINDQAIAVEMYDTGVNMGTGVAALFLQRSLNVSNKNGNDYPDLPLTGNVGPKTAQYMNEHKRPAEVLKVLNCLQGARYISIMEANPDQEIFFRSWFCRVVL